jgi:hypothetical protein
MPDVNDDMDEIFKKAAENYPLNTDSADWNEVLKTLKSPNASLPNAAVNNIRQRKKYLHLLWLLLLIPVLVVVTKYDFNSPIKVSEKSSGKKDVSDINKHENNNNPAGLSKKKADESFQDNATANSNEKRMENSKREKLEISTGKINRPTNNYSPKISKGIINNKNNNVLKGDFNKEISADNNVQQNTQEQVRNITKPAIEAGDSKQENLASPGNNQTKTNIEAKKIEVNPEDASQPKKTETKIKKSKIRQQHLYAGIITGPDFSTIKLQKIIKTGFTAGVLAGYKLNKNWSIESGFYIDKKTYYSTGKYFSTKKIYIPSYTKIENINGDCYMIEVPVNVKYNFKTSPVQHWFAIVGVSSYFMKKEDYAYRYKHYGQLTEKQISYKNSSTNMASIINIGIGYSRDLNKAVTLRIEPYIKLPVKGVGIGSLPITSSGVYLGFTKNIF